MPKSYLGILALFLLGPRCFFQIKHTAAHKVTGTAGGLSLRVSVLAALPGHLARPAEASDCCGSVRQLSVRLCRVCLSRPLSQPSGCGHRSKNPTRRAEKSKRQTRARVAQSSVNCQTIQDLQEPTHTHRHTHTHTHTDTDTQRHRDTEMLLGAQLRCFCPCSCKRENDKGVGSQPLGCMVRQQSLVLPERSLAASGESESLRTYCSRSVSRRLSSSANA